MTSFAQMSSFSNSTSINDIHIIGTDTIILFIGYYQSAVIYSIDRGQNWQYWFEDLWAH